MVRLHLDFLIHHIPVPIVLPLLWMSLATSLWAQLSPGKLHQSHSHLEGVTNCTQCHESGQQLAPNKCLACHSLLADRIKAEKGLHAGYEYRQCGHCHIEHQGRTFNLIYWQGGKEAFDHQATGFALEGGHRTLKCEQCHKEANIRDKTALMDKNKNLNRTFLGLSQNCLTCHEDQHAQQLPESCLSCHNYNSWKPASNFNHANTYFPLLGRHQTVACDRCHPQQKNLSEKRYTQYKNLVHNQCSDCHRDIHNNRMGSQCNRCHTPAGWRGNFAGTFNHDLTAYPLRGKHAQVECAACHLPGQPLKIANYASCRDCHKDYHQGQFSIRKSNGACEECHTFAGFSPALFTLSEHQKSGYALTGAHLAVPCISCHVKSAAGIQFRFKSQSCTMCHPDPHAGAVKRFTDQTSSLTAKSGCEYCHTTDSWSNISFDHTLTGFTLEYRHKEINCISCHKKDKNKKISLSGLDHSCQTCHADIHYGQFAEAGKPGKSNCSNCHQPESWHRLLFNHSDNSRFPLQGKHNQIACQSCHRSVAENGHMFIRYKPLTSECISCHGNKTPEDSSYIMRQTESKL